MKLTLSLWLLSIVLLAAPHASAAPGFLYVLNDSSGGNQIYAYSVTESTGALTALAGFPLATGGVGDGDIVSQRLAIDAANHRLYALNGGTHSVSAYAIDPATGALSPLTFSPIAVTAASGDRLMLALHRSGSPLIVGDGDAMNLASFRITASSASQAAGSPFSTGPAPPFSIAFSQDGNYVYTGGGSGTKFAVFGVAPATGVLTQLAVQDAIGQSPAAYATDASGRLFVACYFEGTLRAFATSAGIPTPATGNPLVSNSGTWINSILHPRGYYLVADELSLVGVYKIAGSGIATTLTSVSGSPFDSGASSPAGLALNLSGSALFVANIDSRNLTTFQFDLATGVLSSPVIQPADALGTTGSVTGLAYLAPDSDADGLTDDIDNCPSVANSSQTDADGDGVGDACDNCVNVANPRVTPNADTFLTDNPWATLTGGQRDDDHDGYGNVCDADFPGTTQGGNVGPADLAQFKASNGKDRRLDVCGTPGTRPCAIFDLDLNQNNVGAAVNIGPADVARFKTLNGSPAGPKCAACPLPCANGTAGTCGPVP